MDLQLRANETYGLVGESGSGKSTLGRIVCGLIQDHSGAFTFQGQSVQWTRETRSKIQMVFQDPFSSLNLRLKVGDAIAEPMIYHGLARNAAESKPLVAELLEQVGLQKESADRYPFEFSGGQRQRIVLARALASKPKLIVCDESVASLDVQIQAQVLNLLRDLQERHGFSCLFISHDLAVIRFIADRIGVLEKGVIVEEGPRKKCSISPNTIIQDNWFRPSTADQNFRLTPTNRTRPIMGAQTMVASNPGSKGEAAFSTGSGCLKSSRFSDPKNSSYRPSFQAFFTCK